MSSHPSEFKLPPQHTQILVIGGGPAGSFAACVLAREGFHVTVFEAEKFPRYHIGESLIPSVRHYFRFIGAENLLASHGFVSKPGSAIKFNQFKREGYTDFIALGHNNNAWNVIRSEFDQMLINHARTSGAAVYELTRVNSVSFSSTDPTKPISVEWTHTPPPSPLTPPTSPLESTPFFSTIPGTKTDLDEPVHLTGTTTFSYLVDATGRAGIMSTKYLNNRRFNSSLKNIAVWAYWTDVGTYGIGTRRHGAPWFEALTDESGWAWFIPLHDGTTSVGIVMNKDRYAEKMKQPVAIPSFLGPLPYSLASSSTATRYLSNLNLVPGVLSLITTKGRLKDDVIRSASDYSYSAPSYAGSRYRIVGDAGAFIDPFFSSGIHLALTSALSAAATICASIRGDCSEKEASDWHSMRVSTSYTRFLVVVLSAYKQIRAQSTSVLSDIDEDNYDRAFSFLRPIIQGASEMGARLSENELQKSLDFCLNLFNPTTPEQHERLSHLRKFDRDLFDVTAPITDPAVIVRNAHAESCVATKNVTSGEASPKSVLEAEMILNKINARKVVHSEYLINNLESESLGGFVVRLARGQLGLARSGRGAP